MQLHFLSPAQTPQGDPFALLILGILVIALVIYLLVKNNKKKKKAAVAVETAPAAESPKTAAPGSAGQIKLYDVEPKTAAMLMAIVADKLDTPLNELRFISIREVKDDEV